MTTKNGSLNEYHKKRNIEALREVEKMKENPLSLDQMREQQRKINDSTRQSLIEHIASYLSKHESIIENYAWVKFDISELKQLIDLSDADVSFLGDGKISQFYKTIKLKEILSPVLNYSFKINKDLFNRISLWLVKKWGGIYSGNDKELLSLIHQTIDCHSSNLNISFNRISSTSKVLCFMFPESNIIYDSRVAYSLNWILLQEPQADQKYFPIPISRNSKLNAFDMKTLIRVKNIRLYLANIHQINNVSKRDLVYFYSEDIAYREMNALLSDVNRLLWNSNPERKNEPFFIQMLLFTLADIVVFREMKIKLKKALIN